MLNPRTPKSQCFSVRVTKSDVRGLIFFAHGANALQATLALNFGGEGVVPDRRGLNTSFIYSTNWGVRLRYQLGCAACRTPQLVLSRSLMFSHLLVSQVCCGNITLHAADLIPNCAKHWLFTSKCLLSASRPMVFLFPTSQLCPKCTKHSVFTGKCTLCAARPNFFLVPNSTTYSKMRKALCFHR